MHPAELIQNSKLIDTFLKSLYKSNFPLTLANGIENNERPSFKNIEKFKTLEFILEELNLVEFVRGRDNTTLSGQCEYKISLQGRKLIENDSSCLALLFNREASKISYHDFNEIAVEEYENKRLNKRIDEADFFLDIVISEKLINLDKTTIKKYFKEWYIENHEFDLQIKDGDFVIEDRDIQTIPAFSKDKIPEFMNWFENRKDEFVNYLKERGVKMKNKSEEKITNHGNLIINKDSKIQKQTFKNENSSKETIWSKIAVIVSIILVIIAIIELVKEFYKS